MDEMNPRTLGQRGGIANQLKNGRNRNDMGQFRPAVQGRSKRVRFQRILNDMLQFSPEQLDVMLKLGRKVRSAKLSLNSAANEAQQFMDSLSEPRQLELLPK